MNIRKRTWEIVEAAKAGDTASRVFDISILSLIFLNVLAVIVGSVHSIQMRWGVFLAAFEVLSVVVFTVEYVARLWSCTVDPRFSGSVRGRIRLAFRAMSIIGASGFVGGFSVGPEMIVRWQWLMDWLQCGHERQSA